jgi:peroxiredoxin
VVPVESGVQTVILRPKGKSAAVINGQYVQVGDKLGDKKVVKIAESEVVLQGEGGREVMKVTPDIEKVPVKKKAAAKRRTTGTTEK